MKLIEFLKPDFKKTIVFLLLACPITIWFLAPQLLDNILKQFNPLYIYLELSYFLIEVMYVLQILFLGIIPYGQYLSDEMNWITVGIVFLYLALIYYVFSCAIVIVWNKAARHFSKK